MVYTKEKKGVRKGEIKTDRNADGGVCTDIQRT